MLTARMVVAGGGGRDAGLLGDLVNAANEPTSGSVDQGRDGVWRVSLVPFGCSE